MFLLQKVDCITFKKSSMQSSTVLFVQVDEFV